MTDKEKYEALKKAIFAIAGIDISSSIILTKGIKNNQDADFFIIDGDEINLAYLLYRFIKSNSDTKKLFLKVYDGLINDPKVKEYLESKDPIIT